MFVETTPFKSHKTSVTFIINQDLRYFKRVNVTVLETRHP